MKEMTVAELRALVQAGETPGSSYTLLDVREPDEVAATAIDGSLRIPLAQVVQRMGELDPSKETIVHCAGGTRSKRAIVALCDAGFKGELINLEGGVRAWNETV
ncbi:rhodanese-like domain-containing protein [Actinomyces trachealis]|uniref:rhodanese-like domain-containing protein n=1 Tax=Actinomyces trachealis TaxID=2763540 RepID=UPI00189289F1|nr:rhodanese-like domain-containing protein [Actinomyces trachealis]